MGCLWCQGPRHALISCDAPREARSRWCAQHRTRATLAGRHAAGLSLSAVGLDLLPAEERGGTVAERGSPDEGRQHAAVERSAAGARSRNRPKRDRSRGGLTYTPEAAMQRAEALRPAFLQILAEGTRGWSPITRALNERGIRPPTARAWHPASVQRMLILLGLADQAGISQADWQAQQAAEMLAQAEALRPAVEDILAGDTRGPTAIARALDAQGVRPPGGASAWGLHNTNVLLARLGLLEAAQRPPSARNCVDALLLGQAA